MVAIPFFFVPWLFLLAVPTTIGLSIFLFVVRMRAPEVAKVCKGVCPDCGYSQKFDLPVSFDLPLPAECAKCNRELTLKEHHNVM